MGKGESNFDLAAALKNNPETTGKYKGPVNRDMEYENEQADLRNEADREVRDQFREGKRKEKARKSSKEGGKDKNEPDPITTEELIKGVVRQEQNPDPERQKELEKAKAEVEKGVEDAAKELTENPEKQIKFLVDNQTISKEQGDQVLNALTSPQGKKSFLNNVRNTFNTLNTSEEARTAVLVQAKDTIKNVKWGSFLGGVVVGTGARVAVKLGAIAAFGASIPVLLGAGAAAGAGIEGFKAAWRESKIYNPREIMDRFHNSSYLEKAAMLGKLEDLWAKQKFDASPEEYQQILVSLYQARAEMQTELDKKDGKFANMGERDKIEYILKLSQGERNGLEGTNRSKEAKEMIKNIEKSLDKNYSKHRLRGIKGKWGTVARAAGKGALFGLLGSGLAAGVGAIASEFIGHGAATVTTAAEVKPNVHDVFTQHLDHRGITGGARDALHNFITEQRGIDPNFAGGVTVEQLVFAEDTLAKEALHHGISANVHEITWSTDQLATALEKANVIGVGNGPLTQGGLENIHHLIGHKPHFLSEATRQAMMNFTPDQAGAVVKEIISQPGPLIMTATDFATMNSVLLATSLLESLALQKRQEARTHLEYIKQNAQVVPDEQAGSDYAKFPGWPSKATKRNNNEKFPIGAPPSPHNNKVEETPIPKPEGSPFDNQDAKEAKQESGISEQEFNDKYEELSKMKEDQPERYKKTAGIYLKKFALGKENTFRKNKFKNWTDSDFKRLLEKLENPKVAEKAETPISKEEFDSKLKAFKNYREYDNKRYQELIRLLGDFSNGKSSNYREMSFKDWTDNDFSRLLQELGEATISDMEEPSKEAELPPELEVESQTEAKEGNKNEITPNSIDERFKKAGFKNVKVVRWPQNKITKEQKAKIDQLADLFMQSLTALKESDINNEVTLDFYPRGSKVDLNYSKKKFYVGIPLNNKPYSRENFYAIGDWMLESKVKEAYDLLKTEHKFKFKKGEQKRFNKLSPTNQYRAYKKLLSEYENRKSGSTEAPKLEVDPLKLDEETPLEVNKETVKTPKYFDRKLRGLRVDKLENPGWYEDQVTRLKSFANGGSDGFRDGFENWTDSDFKLLLDKLEGESVPALKLDISQRTFNNKFDELEDIKADNPKFYKGLIQKYNNYANGGDDTHRATAFKGWSNADFKQLMENLGEKFKPWDKARGAKPVEIPQVDPETKDLWEVNNNISHSEAFSKFPLQHRLEANRIVRDLIENNFNKGFPTNIKIEFSDRFKTQPGKMTIDLSRLDEKYINGQLRAGIRQTNPNRWLDTDQKVIDRYDRRYPQQQSEQQRAVDATAERFANKVVSEIFPYAESPELEEWLEKAKQKTPAKVSDSESKKFKKYFEAHKNDWIVDQAKSILDSGLQKTIPETDDEEFIKYVKSDTLEEIADALNKGGEVNINIANELRNKYAQFEKDAGAYRREKRRVKK